MQFYKVWPLLCCLLLASAFVVGWDSEDEEDVATEIEAVVQENLRAIAAEDLEAMLYTMHPQSPAYSSTRQTTVFLFETYDLRYDLLSFSYLGQDGEYAFARIKQTTEKISGPAFQDNNLDAIHIFRKENGEWKFWTTAILEIEDA